MKRFGNLIEKIAELNNLYLAFNKACRGKQFKHEVLAFRENFDRNISLLREEILSGNVDVGNYHYFVIRDPKTRKICAAKFNERILHHAIMNVCHDIYDKRLVPFTFATRKGKGVYAALEQAQLACGKYRYTVKLDFRKYYDSIDHDVMKHILTNMFKDKVLLSIFNRIIDSYCVTTSKGLPIGNLTSQYFANTYLSSLDHYIKEALHAPIYIRYMDDLFLASDSREQLRLIVAEITRYSSEKLRLTLKPPIFRCSKDGQVFLGYRVLPHRLLLSGRSKKRFRSKLIDYHKKFISCEWNEQTLQEHIIPLMAFVNHARCEMFRRECMKLI